MAQQGRIVKVAGPLIVAENMADVRMYDVVRVSKNRLVGEVIELRGDKASIQVYEETSGLGPGEPVESTGAPLSVELGPGLIESIFDGIQRPLTVIAEKYGMHITRGVEVPSLNRDKEWGFEALVKPGDKVTTILKGMTISGDDDDFQEVEVDTFTLGKKYEFKDIDMGDGTFMFMFEMTDVQNNTATSKVVTIEVEGDNITFSDE